MQPSTRPPAASGTTKPPPSPNSLLRDASKRGSRSRDEANDRLARAHAGEQRRRRRRQAAPALHVAFGVAGGAHEHDGVARVVEEEDAGGARAQLGAELMHERVGDLVGRHAMRERSDHAMDPLRILLRVLHSPDAHSSVERATLL